MKPYTYLFIDLACIAIPFIASFYKKFLFYKEWKYFFPANLLVAFLFLVWDYWFTKIGVWGFNENYLTGIYLFNLPLEEVLFFICIPYACVFTYFICKKYIDKKHLAFLKEYPLYLLLALSLIFGALYTDKLYTFSTALLLFVTLLFVKLKKINIHFIVLSYMLILPFFFISNGLLTGSFLESPIVWYNNAENMTTRMFTIPVEDAFYGFLLILLNIILYENGRKLFYKRNN